MKKEQVVLIILDGWGYSEKKENNAIATAKKPFWDQMWKKYPHCLLKASGEAVGLPNGQMGNSEVGHMTIGAGRPADTDIVRINKAINDGSFDTNIEFLRLFDHVKKYGSTLHVQGLVSPGGVHSHQNHLYAFLKLAKKHNIPMVAIHVFTDGRDTAPQSASEYLRELEDFIKTLGPNFFIATISGRYFAMDRDNNWDRLAKVEKALFDCKGNVCNIKPSSYMDEQYKIGTMDETLEPTVCSNINGLGCAIKKNDGVFFFNFRADRARMLSEKILERQKRENIMLVTLTEYCVDFVCHMAFPPQPIETTLGLEISNAGLRQAHISETEKFAHATYFLNGGREKPYPEERDVLIDSRKDVKTHDQAPEMRAEAIADKAIEEIAAGTDFIFINFANADMVGHTANIPAIIKAVETIDTQLERIVTKLETSGGIALISADHGNAEMNIDQQTGIRHTAHTTNPVPCILTTNGYKLHDGELSDIAPTILKILDIKIPPSMTGKPLV
ncbi:MAG: 2,3-bisphosphoglycerate-independent phosphoglycerate mutase [Candidatus Taylorbacteria bacterium]